MIAGSNPIWFDMAVEAQLTDEGYAPIAAKQRPKALGWRGYRYTFGKGLRVRLASKLTQPPAAKEKSK